MPGIGVTPAPGHTPGHMVVSASSGGERLLYVGDTVLYPLHLEHPDWLPWFDLMPGKAAVSKRAIFDLAATERTWVFGQHFPPSPAWDTWSRQGRDGSGSRLRSSNLGGS